MAREGRSHVRKRKKGCLVGCLTNLMLLLGVIALVFVGAHVLGFVESDPQTGAPTTQAGPSAGNQARRFRPESDSTAGSFRHDGETA